MTSYETIYWRPCRSPVCWTEVVKRPTTGPDLVRDTFEKMDLIRKLLLMAQSKQTSYKDRWWRPLEFEVGDHVFLKVMPRRGVVRYIWPFEVLERVGTIAYQLALPPTLLSVHVVFHVSMLRKYTPN